MIGLLLALYPAPWRRRYGEELRVVLESRPLGPYDVADVLLGALDARLTRFRLLERNAPRGGHQVVLRIGGYGAVAGGILWFIGLAGASLLDVPDGVPFVVLAMVGLVGLLLALIGLSAFQARTGPALAWAALLIPALGSVVALAGMYGIVTRPPDMPLIGDLTSWSIWFLGMLGIFVGSILFAVATIRAAVLSQAAAIGLGVSSFAVIVLAMGLSGDAESTFSAIINAAAMGSFSGSWALLGLSALRRGPIRAIAPA